MVKLSGDISLQRFLSLQQKVNRNAARIQKIYIQLRGLVETIAMVSNSTVDLSSEEEDL